MIREHKVIDPLPPELDRIRRQWRPAQGTCCVDQCGAPAAYRIGFPLELRLCLLHAQNLVHETGGPAPLARAQCPVGGGACYGLTCSPSLCRSQVTP